QADVIFAWRDKAFQWSQTDPLLGGVIQRTLELMTTVEKHGANAPKLDVHVRQLERLRRDAIEEDGRRDTPIRSLVYGIAESFGAMVTSLMAMRTEQEQLQQQPSEEREMRHLPDIKQEHLFEGRASMAGSEGQHSNFSNHATVHIPKSEGMRQLFATDEEDGFDGASAMDDDDDDDSVCIVDTPPPAAPLPSRPAYDDAPGPSQPRVREASAGVGSALSSNQHSGKRPADASPTDRPKRQCGSSLYGFYDDMFEEAAAAAEAAEAAADDVQQEFRCDKCDKSFRTEFGVRKHQYVHSGIKCSLCHKYLAGETNLLLHMAHIHPDPSHPANTVLQETTVPGPSHPPIDPSIDQSIDQGRDQASASVEKPFGCAQCSKTFRTVKLLRCHEKLHSNEIYKCSNCEVTRTNFSALKVHLREAHGIKPYKCEECGELFERKSQEIAHRREKHQLNRSRIEQVVERPPEVQ
ncbi:hypothetical protein PFISCL1PPCAC_22532, partial [Pristionchus fissidentatus]